MFLKVNLFLSQDLHFSQMEYSPLTLNPALAGALSPLQGVVNFRSQWRSLASPYTTIAASLDGRLNPSKNKTGIIACGLNVYNDHSGDLKVVHNQANIHLAYHLILSRKAKLGMGIYSGFGQRSIQPNAGKWGSQYSNGAYNPSISSGETLNNVSFSYLDAGSGLVYNYHANEGSLNQNEAFALHMGVAAFHLNRPSYSFSGTNQDKLSIRYTAFANATIGLQNWNGALLPGIYFQRQGAQNEWFFGSYYKYIFKQGSRSTGFSRPMAIYLGLYHRLRDAFVGKFMFEYDCYSFGLAYDTNISSLRALSKTTGAFEVFIRYNLGDGGGFRSGI